ncbi:DUF4190 domain-containing protein [Nocardioides ultimimeridianus]
MSETNGENPENPYGNPPPPSPYTPPSNPYGAPPPSPYGGPQFNPSSFPSYGESPQYGGPQYAGGPGYPGAPAKTDGMAIGALIASVLGFCTCIGFVVGIVLGFISLSRTKASGAGGRGMAIAGIVLGFVGIVLGIVLVVVLAVVGFHQIVTPSNAKAGQCVNIDEHDANAVTMTKRSCTQSHDGEIIATATITNDNLQAARQSNFCQSLVDPGVLADLEQVPGLSREWVSEHPTDIRVGDHVVCYVRSSTKLTEDLLH